MPTKVSTPEPGEGDRLAAYLLEARLGEGGMGVVFRAVRETDGEVVALKLLRPELAEDDVYVRRFEREGRAASGLVHPHLVSVLDTGSHGGRRYLVTSYVEGASLADVLEEGVLSGGSVVRLAAGVGSALDALHGIGLVHRDVKPSNILVDERGRSLLTDFGVARGDADTALTAPGRVVGTVDYLAPEVIRGKPSSPASDMYALGCVVHECLAGTPPFGGLDFAGTCRAHVELMPPDLRSLRPDVPPALHWAALRALAKEPGERPATGAAYARLLRAGL
jgi:serine/threonine protein kinase